MTGLLVGLGLGVGLFLVWWSCWVPGEPPIRPVRRAGPLDRLADEVVQAGFAGLSVRTLGAACVIAFVLVLALVQATVGVLPIALCFAAMAGYGPVAVVRARARRRRARLRDLWPDAVDNITSGVRAGMALPEALAQLGTRGPEELRTPLRPTAFCSAPKSDRPCWSSTTASPSRINVRGLNSRAAAAIEGDDDAETEVVHRKRCARSVRSSR